MTSRRLLGAFALTLAGALALSACGDSDDERPDRPDAGPAADTGTDPVDTGVDAGITDTGSRPDAGDTGVAPDAGPRGADEGEECVAGTAPCAMGLACVNFGEFAVCLNTCNADAECAGSDLIPPSESCRFLGSLTAGDGTTFGYCVQQIAEEGDVIFYPPNPTVETTRPRLATCGENTIRTQIAASEARCLRSCDEASDCVGSAIGPECAGGLCIAADATRAGEGEFAVISATEVQACAEGLNRFGAGGGIPGRVACARTCETEADCTTPGIEVCNLNRGTFTSTAIIGVCTRGEGLLGAPCSNRHVVNGCNFDRETYGQLSCSDLFGLIDDDEPQNGICTQFCGDLDNDPITPVEMCRLPSNRPGDPQPTCLTRTNEGNPIFGMNFPGAGFCSDNCTNNPNSCGGISSACYDPNAMRGFTITTSFCVVPPAEPTLPLWDARGLTRMMTPPAEANCEERPHRCPEDTFCLSVGTGRSLCVYGCNAEGVGGLTGCEGRTVDGNSNLACERFNMMNPEGFCWSAPE